METLAATPTKNNYNRRPTNTFLVTQESGNGSAGIRLAYPLTDTLERTAAIIIDRITRMLISGTRFRLGIGTNTIITQIGKLICLICGH